MQLLAGGGALLIIAAEQSDVPGLPTGAYARAAKALAWVRLPLAS